MAKDTEGGSLDATEVREVDEEVETERGGGGVTEGTEAGWEDDKATVAEVEKTGNAEAEEAEGGSTKNQPRKQCHQSFSCRFWVVEKAVERRRSEMKTEKQQQMQEQRQRKP